MPYRILGGIKFYERAGIKDCIVTSFNFPENDLAFERIVNNPKSQSVKLHQKYIVFQKIIHSV